MEFFDWLGLTGVKSKTLVAEVNKKKDESSYFSSKIAYTLDDDGYVIKAVVSYNSGDTVTYIVEYTN